MNTDGNTDAINRELEAQERHDDGQDEADMYCTHCKGGTDENVAHCPVCEGSGMEPN